MIIMTSPTAGIEHPFILLCWYLLDICNVYLIHATSFSHFWLIYSMILCIQGYMLEEFYWKCSARSLSNITFAWVRPVDLNVLGLDRVKEGNEIPRPCRSEIHKWGRVEINFFKIDITYVYMCASEIHLETLEYCVSSCFDGPMCSNERVWVTMYFSSYCLEKLKLFRLVL